MHLFCIYLQAIIKNCVTICVTNMCYIVALHSPKIALHNNPFEQQAMTKQTIKNPVNILVYRVFNGSGGRSRTATPLRARDFESLTSHFTLYVSIAESITSVVRWTIPSSKMDGAIIVSEPSPKGLAADYHMQMHLGFPVNLRSAFMCIATQVGKHFTNSITPPQRVVSAL